MAPNPDMRPFPPGWSQHYDAPRNIWSYVNSNTIPPHTSSVHPAGDQTNQELVSTTESNPQKDHNPSSTSNPLNSRIDALDSTSPLSFAQQLYASAWKDSGANKPLLSVSTSTSVTSHAAPIRQSSSGQSASHIKVSSTSKSPNPKVQWPAESGVRKSSTILQSPSRVIADSPSFDNGRVVSRAPRGGRSIRTVSSYSTPSSAVIPSQPSELNPLFSNSRSDVRTPCRSQTFDSAAFLLGAGYKLPQNPSFSNSGFDGQTPRRSQTFDVAPLPPGAEYKPLTLVWEDDISQNQFKPENLYSSPPQPVLSQPLQDMSSHEQKELSTLPSTSDTPPVSISTPPPQTDSFPKEPPMDTIPVDVILAKDDVGEHVDHISATSAKNNGVKPARRHRVTSVNIGKQNLDLIHSIRDGYRILDLVTEQGSGGVVDKIIIAQDSLREFISDLHSGAIGSSLAKIDFKALDGLLIKPIGVYGSKTEIVRFLTSINAVDVESAESLSRAKAHSSGASGPALRTGLYIVRSFQQDIAAEAAEQIYVVYWPEDTTWNDNAIASVRRNRVTFMRYLTKITDQVVALISSEHSKDMVWSHIEELEDEAMATEDDKLDRMFTFEVTKTKEQEENVVLREGFNINSPLIDLYKPPADCPVDPSYFNLKLLAGETVQAFMTTQYIPPVNEVDRLPDTMNELRLRTYLKSGSIRLSENLDDDAIGLLIRCGLQERFPQQCNAWLRRQEDLNTARTARIRGEEAEIVLRLKSEEAQLLETLQHVVADRMLASFPAHTRKDLEISLPEVGDEYQSRFAQLKTLYPNVESEFNKVTRATPLDIITDAAYKTLKERILTVQVTLVNQKDLKEADRRDLIDRITETRKTTGEGRGTPRRPFGFASVTFDSWWNPRAKASSSPQGLMDTTPSYIPDMADIDFLASLDDIVANEPLLGPAATEVRQAARAFIVVTIRRISSKLCHLFQSTREQALKRQISGTKDTIGEEAHKLERLEFIQQIKDDSQSPESTYTMVLDSVQATRKYFQESYKVSGCRERCLDPMLQYKIYRLELSAEDQQSLQLDRLVIPSPMVEPRRAHSFRLPLEDKILHAQLLGNDKCLLIVERRHGNLSIFCERMSAMDDATRNNKNRKYLHRDKIGQDVLFAFDEAKRMLAVCASSKLQLHIFVFDEMFTSVQALGSAVNLAFWYSNTTSICHMCFVCGQEEVLLVDTGAQARIFSLITQQFRPASLQLNQIPTAIYSSPDGSCLLTLSTDDSGQHLRAYHWNSFGSTEGIPLEFRDQPDSAMVLSSLMNRSIIHLIGLDVNAHRCQSVALDVTGKVTEFRFKEKGTGMSRNDVSHSGNTTSNNCLIDCHADVWTRFPVVPAIRRQTFGSSSHRLSKALCFVTDRNHDAFALHFSGLIESFETNTKKPTDDELENIHVQAMEYDDFISSVTGETAWPVSCLRAGEWLVDLLCLIPIHLAITRENRFVPLKDGVYSAELEKSLLGAELGTIVDSLSFGWYESIFQSYMASKPVKVVSSMGEQSVGKSFTLNHFVDTSFAGSAMRTTEGVWMSVTPTQNTLIVALDFEGVHSIERSAQEDTLLVLFNTAISNLILFRNNFALSREITGLFQSFQSSSSVLDPAANPSLFQSTLVVIIKDVIDSDKLEITREFQLKLQKIVEEEQDSNFISRLHGGKLDIVPWPVIESRQFYTLFQHIQRRLDQQAVTHTAAGEFLLTLKTLMAKLKTNDWGALSQTLAAHRAQRLLSLLPNALSFGYSEMEPEVEPLKNFDSDVVIDIHDTSSQFFLSAPGRQPEERESALMKLLEAWDHYQSRHGKSDRDWIADLSVHLDHLVEMRVKHVQEWISSNLLRFKTSHANIETLRRTFESTVVDLRANAQICKMQCRSCHLHCLQSRLHEGLHDCQTSHQCVHNCEYSGQHQGEQIPCGFNAGHPGSHICVVSKHLCGEPCRLTGKLGCMESCTKFVKHSGGHMCSALVHACGEPCALKRIRLTDGQLHSCTGTCSTPSHEVHSRHSCDKPQCSIECQLCKSLCVNPDHLHGLEPGAVHLCGEGHSCKALCSADGICQIDLSPHSIEATFTGRYETFQYTKYSQVAKRLPCAIPIRPGDTCHPGKHNHGPDPDAFHFCISRCENCGYFCTLPLGHPQQEHETSHGSMSRTRWAVDGAEGTIFELNGRKFASDDTGAPMMCSIVCQAMGRHAHIDYCRAESRNTCRGAEIQHCTNRMTPHPNCPKDWVTHGLHWRRSGFKDPYSREDQANFAKCDAMCSGPEHSATDSGPAQPSYCTLPLFHAPHRLGQSSGNQLGYVSTDGHSFACKNPVAMQQAFHVIFVIDRSGSMGLSDRRPLQNTPSTELITRHVNNRLGAVYSALDAFWRSRDAATGGAGGVRRDAYSILLFDSTVQNCLVNNFTSSPDQLLAAVITHQPQGGTNFDAALTSSLQVMQQNWSTERTPVIIFLSDGECRVTDQKVQDLCRAAVAVGKPLSFHAISFGTENTSLRRMVEIAQNIQDSAPRDPLTPASAMVPSSYAEALTSVRLAETFMGIAESLRKPRGSLLH